MNHSKTAAGTPHKKSLMEVLEVHKARERGGGGAKVGRERQEREWGKGRQEGGVRKR